MNARLIAPLLVLSLSWTAAADLGSTPEVATLKASYQAEIARLTDPVNKRYAEALSRLQETYTKAGQLDKALVAKAELDALVQQLAEAKIKITDRDLDESRWT